MDYDYALNYWRKALTQRGGDAKTLNMLIDEINKDADAALSFVAMLEACNRGEFGRA